MLFPVTLWRHCRDSRAVHEDDLPNACLFLEKDRFKPFLAQGAGGVGDAALIDVCNPSDIADDVDVRFSHVSLEAFARCMQTFDHGHDGIPVESDASIVDIKIRCDDGVELRNIVCAGCSEYRADCIHDLSLVGGEEFLLRPRSRDVRGKQRESSGDQGDAKL